MSLHIQIEGVDTFLEAIFGSGVRSSTILASLGCTPEQLRLIRERHMEALTTRFVAQIADLVQQQYSGERRYRILARRLGLDGEPPSTLVVLAAELGISRERVRQITASTVGHCRFRAERAYFQESLFALAASLLAEDGIVLPPYAPVRVWFIPFPPAPAAAHPRPAAGPESPAQDPVPVAAAALAVTPLVPEVPAAAAAAGRHAAIIRQLRETLEAIYRAAGKDISYSLLAQVLGGGTGTVAVALVEHYHLQFAHGAFGGITRSRLKVMVREALSLVTHNAAPVAGPDVATVHPPAPDAPDQEEIRAMVEAVHVSVAHRLSDATCGHTLFGSHGLVVDGLLGTRAPHYGVLRSLGIKRVMELVRDARTDIVLG